MQGPCRPCSWPTRPRETPTLRNTNVRFDPAKHPAYIPGLTVATLRSSPLIKRSFRRYPSIQSDTRLSSSPPTPSAHAARQLHRYPHLSNPHYTCTPDFAMNNFSFLESAQQQAQQQQQHNQSRPPPSPSHSQAGSIAASQVNGGGQNGVPMVNGLPSGGQQTDMNHLWAVVQQLSQLLEENKAQTRGIVEGVAAIQGRAALEEGGEVGAAAGPGGRAPMRELNGEINGMSIAVCRDNTNISQQQPRRISKTSLHQHNRPLLLSLRRIHRFPPSLQTTNLL